MPIAAASGTQMTELSAHYLLEQMHWLRNVARQLVRDPHLAEDAVQDAVVAALRQKQSRPAALRGWLGTALRNAVRQRYRADSRRGRREARIAASLPAAAPSALEVVAELSTYRRLLDLVDSLEEPYRTAITRRFVRGESPDEIARHLGIPTKTVYTRIHRGLDRLRDQLDESVDGGRRAWRAAFLLAPLPRVTPAAASLPHAQGDADPTAATDHAGRAISRAGWVDKLARIILSVPIPTPFPHVSQHIV